MKTIIEINNLTKCYGKNRGINNLTLSIAEGDFFGFIGPNGAGKSTTIRTLLGLISPDAGNAAVCGYDIVQNRRDVLMNVGYLPSEINFYKGMKVKDVLKYSAALRQKNCDRDAKNLAERLELNLSGRVEELSLGNRKKVGVICAVQHHPRLIILDEPTSGLDPLMQREFFNILKEENERGATVFFSSHILSEIQEHCRNAAFIKDGRIILKDKVSNLEHTGAKKIYISGEYDAAGLEALNGIKKSDNYYLYTGDIQKLLDTLAGQHIRNINIVEPSLEEIFMDYYKTEQEDISHGSI